MFYVYADLCSLLAATSKFSILIGQKMQLTGCHNGNEMRNAICVDSKISIEWPYCSQNTNSQAFFVSARDYKKKFQR